MSKKKVIVFDSSTLISFSNVCILWLLPKIKEKSGVRFVIGPEVKKEVVDDALRGNRFKFSGIRIMKLIKDNVLEVIGNSQVKKNAQKYLNIANRVYTTRKSNVKSVHLGEMESLALMKYLKTDMLGIDERVLRLFLEKPKELRKLLSKRLKTKIKFNKKVYREFVPKNDVKVISSAEIAAIGYEMGFFEKYRDLVFRSRSEVVKGIFWALKTNGCALSHDTIDKYIRILVGR